MVNLPAPEVTEQVLNQIRGQHAATMAELKGATGREAEDAIVRSCHRLRKAHRRHAISELKGPVKRVKADLECEEVFGECIFPHCDCVAADGDS